MEGQTASGHAKGVYTLTKRECAASFLNFFTISSSLRVFYIDTVSLGHSFEGQEESSGSDAREAFPIFGQPVPVHNVGHVPSSLRFRQAIEQDIKMPVLPLEQASGSTKRKREPVANVASTTGTFFLFL